MDKTIKAAVTGLIGATASYLMGETDNLQVGSMDIPAPVFIAAATGASSLAADYAGDVIYPETGDSDRMKNLSSAALGLGVSGASTSLILNKGVGENNVNAFVLGAASYAAGDWATRMFVNPPEVVRY